jgi:glycosyltransferase involved in cell wall biosynthesis
MKKSKILVDLKPALDGFAGIPQETRLLYTGLRRLDGLKTQGLIQHGGRRLRAALEPKHASLSESKRIFQLSKFIVSLSERPYSNNWEIAIEYIGKSIDAKLLGIWTTMGFSVKHSVFDARLFSDFVWRTFFDKTLSASEKDTISLDDFIVVKPSRKHFHKVGLQSSSFGSFPRYPLLNTQGFDYFLAQTPFPGRLTAGTQMLVRYHDAVPILMPHTVHNKAVHQAEHFQALRSNIASGALFSCISEATRSNLIKIFPEVEKQTFVIHNMVSEEYHETESPRSLVSRLVRNRLADIPEFKSKTGLDKLVIDDFEYLLMVSTIEPRKNHMLLVSAWERLKYTTHPDLKLIVVGNLGWDHGPVIRAFKPWAEKGELHYLQNVPSPELRVLYQHALATICPSLAEGFDYSGIEAMRCGCPVVSSDIAVHREIYQDASAFFNPYSVDDAADKIGMVAAHDAKGARDAMRARGRTVGQLYAPANILPKWEEFFEGHQCR